MDITVMKLYFAMFPVRAVGWSGNDTRREQYNKKPRAGHGHCNGLR